MSRKPADPSSWKNVLKHPKRGVPEGLWKRCPGCQATIFRKEAEKRLGVCPECDYHWYVPARQRIAQVLDEGTFEEWDADLESADPLDFVDKIPYPQRLEEEQQRTGLREAAVVGAGMIRGRRVAFGVTDSAFIMGSMGSVVGEKLTRTVERATAAAIAADHHFRLRRRRPHARGPALADADGQGLGGVGPPRLGRRAVHLRADQSDDGRRGGQLRFAGRRGLRRAPRLIGFAGPRTIKATIRIELPKGFQTSEFLLEHGFIDRIVRRQDLQSELARTIDYCGK